MLINQNKSYNIQHSIELQGGENAPSYLPPGAHGTKHFKYNVV
jgi:hypothetical protein